KRASELASRAKGAGLATVIMSCPRHGVTGFWLTTRGYYAHRLRRRRRSPRAGRRRAVVSRCAIGDGPRVVALGWPSRRPARLEARALSLASGKVAEDFARGISEQEDELLSPLATRSYPAVRARAEEDCALRTP